MPSNAVCQTGCTFSESIYGFKVLRPEMLIQQIQTNQEEFDFLSSVAQVTPAVCRYCGRKKDQNKPGHVSCDGCGA
jgi:hypothetical protein